MLQQLQKWFQPTRLDYVTPAPDAQGSGLVSARNRYVQIWRPLTLLAEDGQTMPGISNELVAGYMVSTVTRMVGTNLGPVSVDWREMHGRFVATAFTIRAWNQSIEIVHPVAPVSGALKQVFDLYLLGIAEKAKELHKAEQNYGPANDKIHRALEMLDELRNDSVPHYNDEEALFVARVMVNGLTLNALIPVSKEDQSEATLHTTVHLKSDGRSNARRAAQG